MSNKKELAELEAKIKKAHGSEVLVRLNGQKVQPVDVISSGSISLDAAMGVGGYPRGRIVEIFGPESSGKTTLTLHAIAETQANGGVAAFIDAEHAFDVKYAEAIGVKTSSILFSQPDYGEQALNIVEEMVLSGLIDLVVVDSVAALTPKKEIDGEMGDAAMGEHARLMSKAMRKLTGIASKNMTTIIFINQLRQKIGLVFGNPETTTGGNALKFYASMRLDVRRSTQVKETRADDSVAIGNQTKVKVVKNKLAPPFRDTTLDLIWGKGIDKIADLLSCALEHGIVERSGAWFSFGGERIAQGLNSASEVLRTPGNEMRKEIENLVRKEIMP